ncbi:Mitochondrial Carrier (MC) Family [Achlya hypogyna]|uniref:Mitochondrial Carrier (MC) Family n=1 Tax=Achlya hypogyna TaxID=1202772 RepID=A0A1V9Z3J1_ACHHY|nr:Mitochondrial Carrier (MC) Family [Achlya hypogyna]
MLDLRETTAGTVGAVCNVYAGLPFDVAKIRLQTQGPTPQYAGLIDVVAKTVRAEGIKSLWKGAVPAMSSAIAENSVLFTANGILHRAFFGKETNLSTLQEATLGGGAGLFAAMAITPTEVIKCRLQMHNGTTSLGVLRCIRQVYAQHGLMGFVAGLPAVVLRDVPFAFFFFGAYQSYTSQLMIWQQVDSRHDLHPLAVMLAGGAAGSTGWSFVFPADVIKSHMQIAGSLSFRDATISVWRRHGVSGFYRGWNAAVLRSFPADGCLFLGVEMTHRLFSLLEPLTSEVTL